MHADTCLSKYRAIRARVYLTNPYPARVRFTWLDPLEQFSPSLAGYIYRETEIVKNREVHARPEGYIMRKCTRSRHDDNY